MTSSNKTTAVVSISVIFALAVGVFIGTKLNLKGKGISSAEGSENWEALSPEELGSKLSEVMLPEEEFKKLEAAIFQTGMGLMAAQAQGAGVSINDEVQKELKDSITEKYSREFFAGHMRDGSMKELDKDALILVLNFYHTPAGQKFLELSPKIIQATMSAVQTDLSSWLPKTVDALVSKLKNGGKPASEELKDEAQPKGDKIEQKAPNKEAGADS